MKPPPERKATVFSANEREETTMDRETMDKDSLTYRYAL